MSVKWSTVYWTVSAGSGESWVQSLSNLCGPMDCKGFPVHHQLWSLLKFMSIASVMPSNHLILGCPLLLLPSIFPSIRVFANESVLCIRWPKYWSFQILGGKILKLFEVLEFTTQLYVVSCFNIPHILIFLLTHGGIGKVNPSWYFIQRLCSFVSLSTWILWEVPCQIVNRKKERYC